MAERTKAEKAHYGGCGICSHGLDDLLDHGDGKDDTEDLGSI